MSLLRSKLSFWEAELLADADYTVLGAGIVGLSTAIEIKRTDSAKKVVVLDGRTLPVGASTRNAGFACFGSITEIADDIDTLGEAVAAKLIAMRWRGLSLLQENVSGNIMAFRNQPGIEIFESTELGMQNALYIELYNDLIQGITGKPDCFQEEVSGKLGYEIHNQLEGSLRPHLMMQQLELLARSLGVIVQTGVSVQSIDQGGQMLNTTDGDFAYKSLVICTNGFSQSLVPKLDIQPARNQVMITAPIPGFELEGCYHMESGYVYFREVDGRLLIGGGRHLDVDGERTTELAATDQITTYLTGIIEERILIGRSYTIDHTWSGILGVGSTKMPIVERLSDSVLVAIRMGGMGIAVGSYIGRVAASILLDSDNSDHQLFVSN